MIGGAPANECLWLVIPVEEFHRAVNICGGEGISASVIDAVYTIFDVDGDGHLSTEEFISIMKSRLKRGIRVRDFSFISQSYE